MTIQITPPTPPSKPVRMEYALREGEQLWARWSNGTSWFCIHASPSAGMLAASTRDTPELTKKLDANKLAPGTVITITVE